MKEIILASGSPRREELLRQAGVTFEKIVSGCDEIVIEGEKVCSMVERLAVEKAKAVAELHPESLVIGADTTVYIDGTILGKPESQDEAEMMLRTIQGRTHEVWGGIALVRQADGLQEVWSHKTHVTMVAMSQEEIQQYVATGEPMDKAGSYAIQGIGLQYVKSIEGSYSNVVGLNISALLPRIKAHVCQ